MAFSLKVNVDDADVKRRIHVPLVSPFDFEGN